ncbi:MAG: hypothetical protein ACREUU_05805, partial [Gammaproteobacteria bacterium]
GRARQSVKEALTKLGVDAEIRTGEVRFGLWVYPYMLPSHGQEVTRRFLEQGKASSRFVTFVPPGSPEDVPYDLRGRGTVDVDQGGKLVSLWMLGRPKILPPDTTIEEEKKLTAQLLSHFFSGDFSAIEPKLQTVGVWGGDRMYSFQRKDDTTGFFRDYSVAIGKNEFRINTVVRSGWVYSGGPENFLWPPGLPLLVLIALSLVLFFRRKLHKQRASPGILLIAVVGAASLYGLVLVGMEKKDWILRGLPPAAGILVAVSCGLTAVEYYLKNTDPARLATFSRLFRQTLSNTAGGLSILRGVLAGMAGAGGFVAFSAAAARWNWALPNFHHWSLGLLSELPRELFGRAGPGREEFGLTGFTVVFMEAFIFVWLVPVLVAVLLQRAVPSRAKVFVATVAVWFLTGLSLIGLAASSTLAFQVSVLLQGLFLAFIYFRWDLLTLMAAVLTAETWLVCYGTYRHFISSGSLLYALPMVPWFLFALLGVTLYFRPQIQASRRRLAEVFQ